jgi:hypothetical protein
VLTMQISIQIERYHQFVNFVRFRHVAVEPGDYREDCCPPRGTKFKEAEFMQ